MFFKLKTTSLEAIMLGFKQTIVMFSISSAAAERNRCNCRLQSWYNGVIQVAREFFLLWFDI